MKKISLTLLALLLIAPFSFSQRKKKKEVAACCVQDESTTSNKKNFSMGKMTNIPNVALTDQHGNNVFFYDLIKGKVVALNFVFTTCKTICPPMGANFVHLKKLMDPRVKSSELVMLTISIDPTTDTPERLLAWSENFEPGEGWTLLTGKVKDVNSLLKKLDVYAALKEEHAPIVLLGKEGQDNWVRANGLAEPAELAATLNQYFDTPPPAAEVNKDENYFTNVELIDQNGQTVKLYQDLMKDKVVIINPFFTECTGVCPVMNKTLQKIQDNFGDRMGKDIHIISLTVDYKIDQPSILSNYASEYGAKKGWYFLTGEKENIEFALSKLGKNVENREAHDSIFLVGNMNTKLWKKVNGLANVNDIIQQIESVLNDTID